MKVIGVIPARGGSKGILNKNLQRVGGHTLIERTIEYALMSNLLDAVVLSSDSDLILKSRKFRDSLILDEKSGSRNLEPLVPSGLAEKPLYRHKRSEILSNDYSRIADTLFELHRLLMKVHGSHEYSFLLLQPTSPFRKVTEIDEFLRKHYKDSKSHAVSVKRVQDAHPARMYKGENGVLTNLGIFREEEFAPRQILSPIFHRDGGYYLIPEDQILAKIPVGTNPSYSIREFPYTLNIDEPQDLLLANALIKDGLFEDNLK